MSGGDGLFEDGEFEFLFCDAEFLAVVKGFESAGADEAVAFVPSDEFFADADDGDVDVGAPMEAGIAIGGVEELFTYAGVLPGRQDAKESEIELFALYVQVDTAEDGVIGVGVF